MCLRIAAALCEEHSGGADVVNAETLDTLQTGLAQRTHAGLILTGHVFEDRMQEVILTSEQPLLVVLDTGVDATRWLAAERKCDDIAAARAVTQIYAAMTPIVLSAKAIVVDARQLAAVGFPDAIAYIATTMGLHLSPMQVDTVARKIAGEGSAATGSVAEVLVRDGRLDAERGYANAALTVDPAVAAALSGFDALLGKRPTSAFRWDGSLFLGADRGGERLGGPIDLTGRSRTLIYGPYLHVPAGRWSATSVFEVRSNRAGALVAMDVFNGTELAAARAELPDDGVFSATLSFTVDDPRKPIEVRLSLVTSAIEGELGWRYVDIEPARSNDEPRT